MRIENAQDRSFLIGDFNDILSNNEKEGGNYIMASSLRDFKEFVAWNELTDLGYDEYPFTWQNNRDAMPIQQRLDRGLATIEWHNFYPDAKIRHVVLEGSDHALLILSTEKVRAWNSRSFLYDARWSKTQECRDLVVEDWNDRSEGSHAFRFCEKMKILRRGLEAWYKGEMQELQKSHLAAAREG